VILTAIMAGIADRYEFSKKLNTMLQVSFNCRALLALTHNLVVVDKQSSRQFAYQPMLLEMALGRLLQPLEQTFNKDPIEAEGHDNLYPD